MYNAIIVFHNGEAATIDCPSIESLHMLVFQMNENIYVKGKLVKAHNGQHPDMPGAYYGGYTLPGLAALFGEKA